MAHGHIKRGTPGATGSSYLKEDHRVNWDARPESKPVQSQHRQSSVVYASQIHQLEKELKGAKETPSMAQRAEFLEKKVTRLKSERLARLESSAWSLEGDDRSAAENEISALRQEVGKQKLPSIRLEAPQQRTAPLQDGLEELARNQRATRERMRWQRFDEELPSVGSHLDPQSYGKHAAAEQRLRTINEEIQNLDETPFMPKGELETRRRALQEKRDRMASDLFGDMRTRRAEVDAKLAQLEANHKKGDADSASGIAIELRGYARGLRGSPLPESQRRADALDAKSELYVREAYEAKQAILRAKEAELRAAAIAREPTARAEADKRIAEVVAAHTQGNAASARWVVDNISAEIQRLNNTGLPDKDERIRALSEARGKYQREILDADEREFRQRQTMRSVRREMQRPQKPLAERLKEMIEKGHVDSLQTLFDSEIQRLVAKIDKTDADRAMISKLHEQRKMAVQIAQENRRKWHAEREATERQPGDDDQEMNRFQRKLGW